MMKRLYISMALCSLSFSAFSANSDNELKTAVDLLNAGKPQEAYQTLLVEHERSSVNPQEWFLLGSAAKASGDYDSAVGYYEKVISLTPDSHRAKLELATVLYQKGDVQRTKQLLLDVKAAKPAVEVSNNIDRFLATIEATGKQRNWRVRGSLGWLYDSNVNAGPDDDFVTMFNLPFVLSDTAKENKDNAILLNVALDHVLPISQVLNWQSNISLGNTNYHNFDNLDVLNISLSTGPTWAQNDRTIWSTPVYANRVKVGHEQSYYSSSVGISPQVRYALNKNLSVSLGTNLSDKHYKENSARDSISKSISPSISWAVSDKTNLSAGLTRGYEDSGVDTTSNDLSSANIGVYHNFGNGLSVSLNTAYTDTNYDEKEAAYTEKRHDKNIRVGMDAIYHVSNINSELVLSASVTNNDSNLEIYEYDRNQISLSIRKAI